MKVCLPWEGPHTEPGEECEKTVAKTVCDELTHFTACGEKVEKNGGALEPGKMFVGGQRYF